MRLNKLNLSSTILLMHTIILMKSTGFSFPHIRKKSISRLTQFHSSTSLQSVDKKTQINEILTERGFTWDKNWKCVAAPMVAQSDLPYRNLVRSYGTDVCYTQMLHAKNLVRCTTFQNSHIDVYPSTDSVPKKLLLSQYEAMKNLLGDGEYDCNSHLIGNPENYLEKGPVIVQLAGDDPQMMVDAAKIVLERTNHEITAIDVNLGCPQGIAKKGNYGAFLLPDTDLVCKILSALRSSIPSHIGVSAKIRVPEADEKTLKTQVQRMILEGGIDLLAVHGRTVKENKTLVRKCNWDMIRVAVESAKEVKPDIPVISNGGIEFTSDVQKCLDYTNADAVMSSEALLENPGLFYGAFLSNNDDSDSIFTMDENKLSQAQLFQRQISFTNQYLDYCSQSPPLPGQLGKVGGSFNVIRGHLFKFLYRYLEKHTDLREWMASSNKPYSNNNEKMMLQISDARELVNELCERHSDIEAVSLPSETISQTIEDMYAGPNTSWYRRHRDAISKVHTRNQQQISEDLSIEDKKKLMLSRIQKMKEQRQKREKKESAFI